MKFIWHTKDNSLSLKPITQVCGVCFDKSGNVLIMRTSGKSWNIPGGKPEINETPETTLKREIEEEVDISISQNGMIGYFEVVSDEPTIYQLRYAAIIDKVNPQTMDPATNVINERKFIKPNEFFDYIKYDEYRPMLVEAVRWYEKNELPRAKTTNVNAGDLNYDKYANEIYDDDIRRSIPGHDNLHQEIIKTVQKYSKHHVVMKILELGIGTGLTSEKILELIPTTSLTAIDFSEQMMDGARKRLSKFKVDYFLGDYSEINFDTDFDMVVSVIGIHHQKDEGKKLLFRKIFESLKAGGIFILGDLVTHKDKHKAAVNDARHYHHLVENARDKKSLEEWAHHHKFLNLLAPIEDQIAWLKEVGFSNVEVRYEYLNTALIVATK